MDWFKTIQENVDLLSGIGSDPTGGMTRLLYSDSWLEAQNAVKNKLEEIGMETHFDEIGNLFGRMEGSKYPDETIMSGSHIDTVINGGNLDGQFGVIAAYVAMAYLKENIRPTLAFNGSHLDGRGRGQPFPDCVLGKQKLCQ